MNIQQAIQTVTAKMQKELETGRRSAHLDAHDLYGVLLSIAEPMDEPEAQTPVPDTALLAAAQEAQQVLDRCAAVLDSHSNLGRSLTQAREHLAAQLRRFGLTQ